MKTCPAFRHMSFYLRRSWNKGTWISWHKGHISLCFTLNQRIIMKIILPVKCCIDYRFSEIKFNLKRKIDGHCVFCSEPMAVQFLCLLSVSHPSLLELIIITESYVTSHFREASCMFPQNSYSIEILNPKLMVLEGGTFGKWSD